MEDHERLWQETTEKLQVDPEYMAAGISIEIAAKVNEAMQELSLTQKELAKRLKVSQPYVSQILAGENNLTILSLCKIAAALELKVSVNIQQRNLPESAAATVAISQAEAVIISCFYDSTGTAIYSTPNAYCREYIPAMPAKKTDIDVKRRACFESAVACNEGIPA